MSTPEGLSSPLVQRAMAVWGLSGKGKVSDRIRWMPPESFLHGEAPPPTLVVVVSNEAGPLRVSMPIAAKIESLSRMGALGGCSEAQALSLLRRVRRTEDELEAAYAALEAIGPLPDRVRVEVAYLFAANKLFGYAMDALEGTWRSRRRAAPGPEAIEEPRRAEPPRVSSAVESKSRARPPRHDTPLVAPWPRPVDTARSEAPTVSELDVARLVRLGQPGGPTVEEAVEALRASRGTGLGVRAIRYALAAREHGPLPATVKDLMAQILAELGDHEGALAALADAPVELSPEPPGIDVDADLTEANAERRAAEAERVLARDADRFGVAERHGRFRAVARAARLTIDAFRSLGGRSKRDAIRDAAGDLERAGEAGRAGEMFALAGEQGEAERVGVAPRPAPFGIEVSEIIAEIDALDRRGLRLAALGAARAYLADHDDADVAAFARGILARVVQGPIVAMIVDGREERVAFGDAITVGRAGATVEVQSPLVSRLHLRLSRVDGAAFVEDLGSHNGTWLAGARLSAPLPIDDGLDLAIGREIPCSLRAAFGGAIAIEVAGERYLAPLGPWVVGGVTISRVALGDEHVIALDFGEGMVTLGDAPIETTIELSRGDTLAIGTPRGPLGLRVLG